MGNYLAKSKTKVETHETTPFIYQMTDDMKISKKTHAFARRQYADMETGEQESAIVGFRKEVDSTSFVKIYAQGIKGIFGLPNAAINVLSVMLQAYRSTNTLKERGDLVVVSYKAACKDYGYQYTQGTYINGVNHLIKNQFIAPSVIPNEYFVNGAFFFKGDRYAFVREYFKVETDQITEQGSAA